MTKLEAIEILSLSPIYFRLTSGQREELVVEYCKNFDIISAKRDKKVV